MTNPITYISEKYRNKLTDLTQPLLDKFGISHFGLGHVSFDGHWSVLSNDVGWLEYAADSQCYLHDPCLVDPTRYHSGVVFFPTHEHEHFQDNIFKVARERFNIDHTLAIVDKTDTGCQFILLGTHSSHTKIINTYISKLSLLRKFVATIKKENPILFAEAQEYFLDLKKIKPDFYCGHENTLDIPLDNHKELIENPQTKTLTPRELDCLKHYLNGKTAKETARLLGLSFRTVEEHIINLKSKLKVRYKRDLIGLFSAEHI